MTNRVKQGGAMYPLTLRIKDLPLRERPRELCSRLGFENVPDSVLLAIILRGGVKGQNVVEMAETLLNRYGSLTALAQAPVDELTEVPGIGPVKAQVLKASLQLARNMVEENTPRHQAIRSPEDVAEIMREEARTRSSEAFWVLLLNAKNRLKPPPREITSGILDASLVHPREVFKQAILAHCAAVVLVHNQPSGDPTPSPEDLRITRQLIEAGRIVDIAVLDHIIVGQSTGEDGRDFFSIRESGLVDFDKE